MAANSNISNEEKRKIYIVTGARKETGIGAIAIRELYHCAYAADNGYVPIVDLKHYQNQFFKDGRVFKDNPWEYYFEQPMNCSLEDIKDDDEVVIGDNVLNPKTKHFWEHPLFFPKDIMKDNKTFKTKNELKKYFRFNSDTRAFAENVKESVMKGEKEVLGILLRGTDYVQRQTNDEFIQPPVKKVIKDARKLLNTGKYKKIYLATEEAAIYKEFKNEFGELLLENRQYMYSDNYDKTKYISEIKVDRENHAYLLSLEYLSSLYILSECAGFLGGCTSGTRLAYIMSDNWKECIIYDFGRYGRYNSIGEKIFSVKDVVTNKSNHKILTLFGMKFKFKRKN